MLVNNQIRWVGNLELLEREKTAFLCSQLTPRSLTPIIQRWALKTTTDDCILCGNESEMEQVIFAMLLVKRVPIILLLATSLPSSYPQPFQRAIDEGRLLVGTHCNDQHCVTRLSAIDRNRLLINLADKVVVGYCTKDGDLDHCTRSLTNVKYVTYPFDLRR